jgi:hypothetical protein
MPDRRDLYTPDSRCSDRPTGDLRRKSRDTALRRSERLGRGFLHLRQRLVVRCCHQRSDCELLAANGRPLRKFRDGSHGVQRRSAKCGLLAQPHQCGCKRIQHIECNPHDCHGHVGVVDSQRCRSVEAGGAASGSRSASRICGTPSRTNGGACAGSARDRTFHRGWLRRSGKPRLEWRGRWGRRGRRRGAKSHAARQLRHYGYGDHGECYAQRSREPHRAVRLTTASRWTAHPQQPTYQRNIRHATKTPAARTITTPSSSSAQNNPRRLPP